MLFPPQKLPLPLPSCPFSPTCTFLKRAIPSVFLSKPSPPFLPETQKSFFLRLTSHTIPPVLPPLLPETVSEDPSHQPDPKRARKDLRIAGEEIPVFSLHVTQKQQQTAQGEKTTFHLGKTERVQFLFFFVSMEVFRRSDLDGWMALSTYISARKRHCSSKNAHKSITAAKWRDQQKQNWGSSLGRPHTA